jgi:hypothetical protein
MKILATLPVKGRDLRLDLFRGVANWGIFLDHIPNNIVNWVTTRNYGFSDAADLFIFISGYTVAFVFARMMLERGFIVGASRLLKRVWQIYVAHVFLFVLYLAEIGYLAQRYGNPGFTDEFNIRGFLANPAQFLFEGLILRFKPVNMDVLPLYIVLMGVFPPILWLMLRRPNLTLAASALLYLMARHFGWNVPAYPSGDWYFNPFAWQFLFHVRGLVCAGWIGTGDAVHSIADRAGAWHRLSCVRSDNDNGGPVRRVAVVDTTGDLRLFQSERQNQPCALSLAALCRVRVLCRSPAAARSAGVGMADLSARNQMRSAVARSVLRRHIPVFCRTFRTGRDFQRNLDADRGQHCRYLDDDRAGVLPVLVEERRQSTGED